MRGMRTCSSEEMYSEHLCISGAWHVGWSLCIKRKASHDEAFIIVYHSRIK
jgi:hypothetical protein